MSGQISGRRVRNAAALAALAVALGGCGGGHGEEMQPKLEVFVLIDLSATWHNPATAKSNGELISEIGRGIATSAEDGRRVPIAIQYRVIGAQSLGAKPICDVVYKPVMIRLGDKKPDYLVTDPETLKSYLEKDCPGTIVRRPSEPLTEISAALASVGEAPRPPGAKRYIIIASDFKEETHGAVAPLPALADTPVLLIYRPVSEDQANPAELQHRIQGWRQRLAEKGAKVTAAPDSGFKLTTVSAFLSPG